MMTSELVALWPVVDDSYTLRQLVAEATPRFRQLAQLTGATLLGDVRFELADGSEGPMLAARAQARRLSAQERDDLDTVATGDELLEYLPADVVLRETSHADRPTRAAEALRLTARGWSAAELASLAGCTPRNVERLLSEARAS